MAKQRLDILLVEKNLAPSRERAKTTIMAGLVLVDGQKIDKAELEKEKVKYQAALDKFNDGLMVAKGTDLTAKRALINDAIKAGYSTKVIPVSTAEYGQSKAARPYNSRLDRSKLMQNGFVPLPDWRDALARYLEEVERI